ncbi:septation ring formation regulator EzrA [Lentilactobacillus sp. Marseille-Q4993]|uniref:septation ring formation regulator EzrA n=1 Tax=Lentilactobacillus sp. Marseille-Q4993 TaxID=3039492 RepID=UPI0024BC791A|nr:septation ring formation regulator EzrA [Lentilactobacillus sp. Marseille-Q4993]
MVFLLLGIVIVVAIAYILFAVYKNKSVKMAQEVADNRKTLNEIPLDDKFRLAGKMNLSGESQKKYDQLKSKYQVFKNRTLPNIDAEVDGVKTDSEGYNYFRTNADWKSANQAINSASDEVKEIQAELAQLHDLNKQHQQAVKEIEDKNQQFRKTLLEDNDKFGDSIDELEKVLDSIETKYDKFTELTENGDPDSAEQVLAQLKDDSNKLEGYLDKVPSLMSTLNTEMVEQLNEIESGYRQMKTDHYNFKPDDILQRVAKLRDQRQDNLEILNKLDTGLTQKNINDMEAEIDKLYDRLELELNSRKKVEKRRKVMAEYIDHVNRQSSDLDEKLKKLSITFDLNHSEIENARQYETQVVSIKKQYDQDSEAIKNGQAVYSEIAVKQDQTKKDLSQIESSQTQLFESVVGIPEKERVAREALMKFDLELRNKKRRVDNLNLPGLPDDYRNEFSAVVREVERLDDSINLPKVNVDDITKQVIMIQSDMDSLEESTSSLIRSATEAEQAMQFSNRYVASNEAIATASAKAINLFDHEYDYQKSLEVITAALDEEKPGSLDKLFNKD